MLVFDNMIMIGSAGRNSGKTYLARQLITHFKKEMPVAALKVTGIEGKNSVCPRGGDGCGACSLSEDFCLDEECNTGTGKDTSLLLECGASKVYWLRCLRTSFEKGFMAFNEKLNTSCNDLKPLVICESNSLRKAVCPGLFVMVMNDSNSENSKIKPSAAEVLTFSDIRVNAPVSSVDIEKIISLANKNIVIGKKNVRNAAS